MMNWRRYIGKRPAYILGVLIVCAIALLMRCFNRWKMAIRRYLGCPSWWRNRWRPA